MTDYSWAQPLMSLPTFLIILCVTLIIGYGIVKWTEEE